MTDPISLTILANVIAQTAAGEAGKGLWQALTSLAHRVLGQNHTTDAAVKQAEQGQHLDLAGALLVEATRTPQAAADVRAWMAEAEQALAGRSGAITNVNVGGTVGIQASHVTGSRIVLGGHDQGRTSRREL
jgi:hypothetical protein